MIPKEDLRWFLFDETIDMYIKRGLPNYEDNFLKELKNFINYYFIFKSIGIISKVCFRVSTFFYKQDNDIWVHDLVGRYPSIIDQLELNYNPIFFGINIKPFFKSLRRKINYYPLYEVYKDLYNGILEQDDDLLMASFKNLESIVKKINPKIIILSHDFTAETRLIALVARELGVPTVEIQHGAYSGKDRVVSGNYVDYVFVWGKFFQNLYLNSESRQDRQIRILGYPLPIRQDETTQYSKRVVYLGQPLELYGDSYLERKKEIIGEINGICKDLGFELIYRKHLIEDLDWLKLNLSGVKFTPKGETLEDTIRNNDIFISFNSTALIESALNSKISVQLITYDIPTEVFEQLGICRSFTSLSRLKDFLGELKSLDDVKNHYYPVDPYYIEIPSPDPGKKFIEFIKEILHF